MTTNSKASLSEQRLVRYSDMLNLAHLRIQQDFKQIDPVIGINRSMRKNAFPADIITIDCLRSGKRILLILHDDNPAQLSYQFSFKDKDPTDEFELANDSELSPDALYNWIKNYFSPASSI